MATKRIKPGTKKTINGKRMVMGFNGRWVSQATYIRQRTERANIQEPKSTRTPNVSGERTRIKPKPVPRGSVGKELPGKGQSTAGSGKSRYQRGLRRDRLAKTQLSNFGRAMGRQLKQDSAKSKLRKAAKGTKGNRTRYAPSGKPPKALPPGKKGGEIRQKGGPLAKRPPSKGSALTRTGVDKVRVETRTPKALPPGKKGGVLTNSGVKPVTVKVEKQGTVRKGNQTKPVRTSGQTGKPGATRKALPPGSSRPAGYTDGRKPPTRREAAQAKQRRAAAGSRGSTTRVGTTSSTPKPTGAKQGLKDLKNFANSPKGNLAGGLIDLLIRTAFGQPVGEAAVDAALGQFGSMLGGGIGAATKLPGGQIAGSGLGYTLGSNVRGALFGDAPTGSSARGEGRATFNQKPKAQQQAPNPVPQQANMPSYGHSPLNVPYQPPVVNPATAMQQQPQRPNPVPPPPTQPPAAPQPVPQQQMPMQQPAPQPQMQQPPQDANEGLRMWQEIHGNAQKSVIDGMNIVERYRKKMAMRGR